MKKAECYKMNKKYVLFTDTVYTLLLYALFYFDQIDDTLFIFSDGVPEKIRSNFKSHIYVSSGKGSRFSFFIRIFSILKLFKLDLKNMKQFGQDHIFYSFFYMNNDFTLLEDGRANYELTSNINRYAKLKRYFLHGEEFGANEKVKRIILTSQVDWPDELVDKIFFKDIHFEWNKKAPNEKKIIIDLFCLNFNIENKIQVLLTGYYSEFGLMTEIEKINMYKAILCCYPDSEKIYIKPHPKEDTDYSIYFNNRIIPPAVPFQLVELACDGVDTLITISSSVGLNTKANVIYHDLNDFFECRK
ncbi:glycosyltransferase family 52 [Shewanella sp. 8A]|uniref:glycosyltransferase family 52 n=2 Tax=Shewanella sp. 8A TaxID=2943323 RepID=UPI00201B205F|nr:glycosyltransferase family 52 [Shewanella sp. 8A]